MAYDTILVDIIGRVGRITLNRPEALNALNFLMTQEIDAALKMLDGDDAIGCILITGSEKAFAAGADIKEMLPKTFAEVQREDFNPYWESIHRARKPVIAAVSGFALGGGCEFAMMADMILASDTAKFGQPEIKLGIIPGAGGTQRLIRAVGKAKAMDLVLTGRMMDAAEAEKSGLVARIFPAGTFADDALKVAETIASYGMPALYAAKEAVKAAQETTLAEGLRLERRLFHGLFATEDQKEGMGAFSEKRAANWRHR